MDYLERNSSLFDDLIGQPLAVELLTSAISKGALSPAYLFSGPEGVGRRLAAFRFLEGIIHSGCESLGTRRRLENFNHPDLLWIEPTYTHQGHLVPQSQAEEQGVSRRTAPQIRLEQVRLITRFLSKQPIEVSRGMVVIESAESMPEASANALLKTLEEPSHGLLILLSSAPERLLQTIRSRCHQIIFNRLEFDAIKQVILKLDNYSIDQLSDQLDQPELSALAAGSPGMLINNSRIWSSLPQEIILRLKETPSNAMQSLSLAKDLTDALDVQNQLWVISWWQYHLWLRNKDFIALERLEKLRKHLLSFVQPRLAWEVALLEIFPRS